MRRFNDDERPSQFVTRNKQLVPKNITRLLRSQVNKAAIALLTVQNITDALVDVLDTHDATAAMMSASDDLESVRDLAEEVEQHVDQLDDLIDKLRKHVGKRARRNR